MFKESERKKTNLCQLQLMLKSSFGTVQKFLFILKKRLNGHFSGWLIFEDQ